MLNVKIIGAGGYGGVGAIELLIRHPQAKLVALLDIVDVGKKISDQYPHLKGVCDMPIQHPDEDRSKADVVFFATPDGVGMREAKKYLDQGVKVIDYSGDFRFDSTQAYTDYATRIGLDPDHASPDLLHQTTYGLCEIYRSKIAASPIVGNPGCFAVSAILGALPALKHDLIDPDTLIFDAKTGVSGAGKKANAIFHYPHRYEEMNAYKVGRHQHVMEVERELSLKADKPVKITFTTQVIPLVRGIMTSIYARTTDSVDYEKALQAYQNDYKNEPFVHVYDETGSVGNRYVRGTNKCALWINFDRRTHTLIVLSHIDNLVKGQAGSAVQNMNVMFGLPETLGLDIAGAYP
jgi:N-acetyl-gamma-glutamyl-phosphate reductase